ncbi:MAG: cardiolipin synthase [Hominimerdicola sp.]
MEQQVKHKKKPKKLLNIMFSQKTTIILLLLAQILLIFFIFAELSVASAYIQVGFSVVAIILAFYILNSNENPAYKLAWIVPLLAVPVFTVGLYMILKNQRSVKRVREMYQHKCELTKPFLRPDKILTQKIKNEDPELNKLANYIDKHGGYPVHENTQVTYFPLGENKFQQMIIELEKAERFIFMEYFIIDTGEMWSKIEEILIRKASEGVEVRLMYDGMGSQFLLPFQYQKKLTKKGIKCLVFNPFRPMLSTIQNNRDHRKILVIDGNIAFNGGVNIADEYINKHERFGHWKDNAVMLKGDGVWNFTMMFLQMWEVFSGEISDYNVYRPKKTAVSNNDGYVIPYGDCPLDGENVGELVYMDIINNAKDYLYITTPYLIPDNEMVTALGYAAKSGVDVKIITPHIPDKWYVHCITRSFYRDLLALGVKIYEYEPGFIHAKTFISDDKSAVVGTINLDYRSLYLHFECATYMHGSSCIKDIKSDIDDMLETKCIPITRDNRNPFSRLIALVLRAFSPLL